ncbi:Insecticidal toxin complex protein TcdA5 [Candidatus Paraburkholderia kirkii]|nr:Insecticidal toxin complex protein TcdA5 [Candidatus Paraburkholderia kirkii]
MPLNAWQGMVRPVVFRERLYIIWVEREETAATEGNGQVGMQDRFTLKLAFSRHDGTWSVPWTHNVTAQIEWISSASYPLGLSASVFVDEAKLFVFLYRIAEHYADFGGSNRAATGIITDGDGNFQSLSATQISPFSALKNTFDFIPHGGEQIVRKASYRLALSGYEIPTNVKLISIVNSNNNFIIRNANIPSIVSEISDDNIALHLYHSFAIILNDFYNPNNSVLKAMEATGGPGDEFISSNGIRENNDTSPHLVYNLTKNLIGFSQITTPPSYSVRVLTARDNGGELIAQLMPGHGDAMALPVNNLSPVRFRMISRVHAWAEKLVMGTSLHNNGWADISTGISDHARVQLSLSFDNEVYNFPASRYGNTLPDNDLIEMSYTFRRINIVVPGSLISNNSLSIDISIKLLSENQQSTLCEATGTLFISRAYLTPSSIIQFHSTEAGAQYMQLGVHRIRLNTLLAPHLVSLAATGIDAILTMSTQRLPEPQLGKGFYVNFTLPAYNAAVHGTSRNFRMHLGDVLAYANDVIYSGQFQDNELTVRLFIPQVSPLLIADMLQKYF